MAQQRGRSSSGASRRSSQTGPRAGEIAAPKAGRAGAPPNPGGEPRAAAEHRARLREVVEPVITAAGYDLENLTVSRVGRRHLLRIAVDSDRGVGLDAVAELSRKISAALDAAEAGGDELIAGGYELEVGSPGVDRPLTEPRHWRRNTARLVAVKAGDRQITGRVRGADDEGVSLVVDGAERRYTYGELGPGRVQIEFKRLDEIEDDDLEDFTDDEEDEA